MKKTSIINISKITSTNRNSIKSGMQSRMDNNKSKHVNIIKMDYVKKESSVSSYIQMEENKTQFKITKWDQVIWLMSTR